jgi:hypothetical protein
MALPDVVSREQWLETRVRLLAEEKELTRRRDALNAARRSLPMVRIEKEYVFGGPDGPVRLADLFGDGHQLIVKHIMFGPDWDAPCPSCRHFIAELSEPVLARLPDLPHLLRVRSRRGPPRRPLWISRSNRAGPAGVMGGTEGPRARLALSQAPRPSPPPTCGMAMAVKP